MNVETLAPPEAKPLARWVPRVLWVIAAVHLLFGLVADTVWLEMVRDGLVGSGLVNDDLLNAERHYALYFEVAGLALLPVAHLAQDRVRAIGMLPLYLGLYLLGIGVLLCAIDPVTGAWSIVAAGLFAIYVSLRDPAQTARSSASMIR